MKNLEKIKDKAIKDNKALAKKLSKIYNNIDKLEKKS